VHNQIYTGQEDERENTQLIEDGREEGEWCLKGVSGGTLYMGVGIGFGSECVQV